MEGARDPELRSARILLVDDQQANVLALESLLAAADFTNVISTTQPSEVAVICAEEEPDLILLDLHMPEIDGFEVLGMLSPWITGTARLPVLVVTADVGNEMRRRAFALGARDFLTKPLDPSEVVARVSNLLEAGILHSRLRDQNRELVRGAREAARELESARLETLERLAVAAEYRDDGSREHAERIGVTSSLLASELGLPSDVVRLIRRAAPLHDVGKLVISDSVLLKEGKLSPEEFEVMKSHVIFGAEILGRGRSPVMLMCEEIALTHHERWDGKGYTSGLRGDSIPLSGRIVALADTFDALTHRRPYKDAWPVPEALAEIRSLSGERFDPRVVDAFESLDHETLVEAAADLDFAR